MYVEHVERYRAGCSSWTHSHVCKLQQFSNAALVHDLDRRRKYSHTRAWTLLLEVKSSIKHAQVILLIISWCSRYLHGVRWSREAPLKPQPQQDELTVGVCQAPTSSKRNIYHQMIEQWTMGRETDWYSLGAAHFISFFKIHFPTLLHVGTLPQPDVGSEPSICFFFFFLFGAVNHMSAWKWGAVQYCLCVVYSFNLPFYLRMPE